MINITQDMRQIDGLSNLLFILIFQARNFRDRGFYMIFHTIFPWLVL